MNICARIILSTICVLAGPVLSQAETLQFGASIDYFFNLKEGEITVDLNVVGQYSDRPAVELTPLIEGASVEKNIRDNLDFLQERGYKFVNIPIVEGFGTYYIDVPILRNVVHEGFNYNSQLQNPNDRTSGLKNGLDEFTAKQKYVLVGNFAPYFASEAAKRGIQWEYNIEALAHIINRAAGAGIGSSGDEITIAGNLPALSQEQMITFLEQMKTATTQYDPSVQAMQFFEEAFSDDYVEIVDSTAQRLGIHHRHSGESSQGYGDSWAGYYYSFYPLNPVQESIYRYLITLSSTPAVNAQIFGAARSMGKRSHLVVGHYTPWPADLNLSIEDLYIADRPIEQGPPISGNDPMDANGNPVETRTSGLQRNYIIYGLISEHITNFFFSVDLDPAFKAFVDIDLKQQYRDTLSEFLPVLTEQRPIVNVIVDYPSIRGSGESDFSNDFPFVSTFSLAEPIYASIAAAGFETWVTYDTPLQGKDISAYWIITAGGGEWIEDSANSESPPLWTNADDLDARLFDLVDPLKNDTPVVISTMAGIPNFGNWKKIRELFGIPTGRGGTETGPAYASTVMIDIPEFQTSLATSILIGDSGEVITDEDGNSVLADILPKAITWNGHAINFRGFDPAQFGQFINIIDPSEVPITNQILASQSTDQSDWVAIHESDATGRIINSSYKPCVYFFRNGLNGKKILINPTVYHLDMLYPLSNILCDLTGRQRTLKAPATAYVAMGNPTCAAFALKDTTLDITTDIPGDTVLYDRFDATGNHVAIRELRNKSSLFPLVMHRHDLVLIRDPQQNTSVTKWIHYE